MQRPVGGLGVTQWRWGHQVKDPGVAGWRRMPSFLLFPPTVLDGYELEIGIVLCLAIENQEIILTAQSLSGLIHMLANCSPGIFIIMLTGH